MALENFKPEWIRELNEVGKQLRNVTVRIPSENELNKAKDEIEKILPPDAGYVTEAYVKNVIFALQYAETHYQGSRSILDDIKNGQKITISNYKERR